MKFSSFVRMHWAAFRALLVLTVITGLAYPLLIWLVAQLPGLHDKAEGSILTASGHPVGSRLIGQLFTDSGGNPLPQYFQSRPSAAGTGYDPTSSSASNLGPESIVDTPADPSQLAAGKSASDAGFKPSLLTQVCTRSAAVGQLEGLDGSRPFCTGGGVGAVLSVIGTRDARGNVAHPSRVVSVNEPCQSTQTPFLAIFEGVRVECAKYGEDYSIGQMVPIRGAAPANPAVAADAVTRAAAAWIRTSHRPTPIFRSPGWPRRGTSTRFRSARSSRRTEAAARSASSVRHFSTCCNSTCNSTTRFRSAASAGVDDG